MIDYPALSSHILRYERLDAVPFRVTLRLVRGSHIAGYDPLHLDNLLARCVVDEATEGRGLPNAEDAYTLPVPIICLWHSDDGLPLWAATPFRPVGMAVRDVAYWHKRQQSGAWTGTKSGRFSMPPQAGRYMERRVPLPTTLCETWTADALGDPREALRLLQSIAYVGKRRSNGFGEVREWRVEPLAQFELVQDGALVRPLPAGAVALLDGATPAGSPAPIGWTPPQWKPSLFSLGWWAGTPVDKPATKDYAVNKAIRLVYLRDLLGRRGYTTAQLAMRCGVNIRTIQRDIADLQAAPLHVPLVCDGDMWKSIA